MLSTTTLESTPIVNVRGEKGQFFVGTLVGHKSVESQYKDDKGNKKNFDIYDFTIEDGDMQVQKKVGKEYVDTPVGVGDSVAVFAPTRLNNALKQAAVGSRIKITYLGLGKATKRGGKPHEYEVEVL